MALTTAQARSVVARWQKWADTTGKLGFDQSTVRGLIELAEAQALLHGTRSEDHLKWKADLYSVVGEMFRELKKLFELKLAQIDGKHAVADASRAVLDAHLKSLTEYADSFVSKRAALLSGEPSALMKSAIGIGRGQV